MIKEDGVLITLKSVLAYGSGIFFVIQVSALESKRTLEAPEISLVTINVNIYRTRKWGQNHQKNGFGY